MPRGRPLKSTIQIDREEKRSLETVAQEVAETIEDEERALLAKLSKRYKDEETGERRPGKTVRGTKTAWTYNDMLERFPVVSFIPDETLPLTYQGVKHYCHAGIESHVPKPFYDIYNRRKRELQPKNPPPGILVELGAGALPAEL